MKTRDALATLAITAAVNAVARGEVTYGDFNGGTAPGWGALTNSGVQPWTAPISGTVVPGTGPLAASNVLQLAGPASFNFAQSEGAALGFDFLSQNMRNDFFAHDQLEFDWYVPPNGSTSGWNELFNIILNSQGGGFTNVAGHSQGTPNTQQFYFAGYTGTLHHVVVDYTTYKNTVLASANPDGGGWLQFGIQPNAGGYSDGLTTAQWEFDNFKLTVAPNNWLADADGTWSTDGNWSKGTHPNAAGQIANFGSAIGQPRTVTVDAAKTVGQINFNNANKYTIAGTSTLTLDSSSAVGINASSGSHDITAPLALAKNVNIAVSGAGDTLTVSDLQSSTVAVTKTGAGTLAVNNVRSGSLTVSSGTVRVLPNSGAAGVSNTGALSVADGAKLDLADNKLITQDPVGTWNGTRYTGVAGLVDSGRNNGAWDGNGIITSMTDATGGILTSIAASSASEALGIVPTATAAWAGQTVTGSNTLVMYTWGGDAEMDGDLDGDDYFWIDSNIAQSGTVFGYHQGDFDYDGDIDGDDYFIIDSNIAFAQTQPNFFTGAGVAGLSTVPEPASISAVLLVAGAILTRRRRLHV